MTTTIDKVENRVWRPPIAITREHVQRVRRSVRYGLHRTRRFLQLLVKLAFWYSWRGFGRLTVALGKWIYDMDSAQIRHEHAGRVETKEYAQAQSVRKANLHARGIVVLTGGVILLGPVLAWTVPTVLAWLVGAVLAVWVSKVIPGKHWGEYVAAAVIGTVAAIQLEKYLPLLPLPPLWVFPVLAVAALLGLGYLGRPKAAPILKNTALPANVVPPLRAPVVIKALTSLGNAKMSEKTEEDPNKQVRLLADIHRDGPGVRGDFELPHGVPASYVVENREKFAAGLRRELGCVWPSVGARHPGHLTVYVTDVPMVNQTQKPWPLAKGGAVDIFNPQPMVTDQRGEWVDLTLAYANMVIGAMPRMGKTFLLREALLVTALDVRTRIYALDGKGTGDLAPLRLVAHFYSVGDDSDEVEDRVLPAFRALREEMRQRAKQIRELPKELCPESKVTTELAGRAGFAPIVVGIDESQAYFGYGDKTNKRHKEVREELTAIVTDLVKRGPALGFIVLMATQNVCDQTIPRQISTNAVYRAALKLFDHTANDQVLGTGAYSRGFDATSFATTDKGLLWLHADGGEPQIVRTVVGLDVIESERIASIARARRDAAGRLTGEAAGEEAEAEQQQVDLLADCRDVMDNLDGGRNAMHLGELREVLADLRPNLHGYHDNESLAGVLREAGVRVESVWSPALKTSQKGIKREALGVAATADVDPTEGDDAA